MNCVIVKDSYPIPRLDDALDDFFGVVYFTTLDCAAGYYQIKVSEDSRAKTHFTTPMGLYEFVRLPFGLTNAPATFQRLMDKILNGLTGVCVRVYLDEIIVYNKDYGNDILNLKVHLYHLTLVNERLRGAGLMLKREKCFFLKTKVHYLGQRLRIGVSTLANPKSVTRPFRRRRWRSYSQSGISVFTCTDNRS